MPRTPRTTRRRRLRNAALRRRGGGRLRGRHRVSKTLCDSVCRVWQRGAGEGREYAGRILSDAVVGGSLIRGYDTGVPTSKIDYASPGLRFHTHPPSKGRLPGDLLSPPSPQDYYVILAKGDPELVVTERGVWRITPRRRYGESELHGLAIGLFIYVAALNGLCEMTGDDRTPVNSLRGAAGQLNSTDRKLLASFRSCRTVEDLGRTYSKFMTTPNGRVLNTTLQPSLLTMAADWLRSVSDSPEEVRRAVTRGAAGAEHLRIFIAARPLRVEWSDCACRARG